MAEKNEIRNAILGLAGSMTAASRVARRPAGGPRCRGVRVAAGGLPNDREGAAVSTRYYHEEFHAGNPALDGEAFEDCPAWPCRAVNAYPVGLAYVRLWWGSLLVLMPWRAVRMWWMRRQERRDGLGWQRINDQLSRGPRRGRAPTPSASPGSSRR